MKNPIPQTTLLALFIFGMLCVSKSANGSPEDNITIIPYPEKVQMAEGRFTITPETVILVTRQTKSIGKYLADFLSTPTGFTLKVERIKQPVSKENTIMLYTDAAEPALGPEGYHLKVTPEQVTACGFAPAGVFYACQSIRQLLPMEIESKEQQKNIQWVLPAVEIRDKPRFLWRGALLDSARHFQDKEYIKHFIDTLAHQKMNRFHWHLADDQGWRIEIKRYPKLTKIGAWRRQQDGCTGGHWKYACIFSPPSVKERLAKASGRWASNKKTDKLRPGLLEVTHGGFYTQADVREIVEFAKSRYITVVPEIDMPGHSQAALAAYPEYSCTGGPFGVRLCAGVSEEVYCVGNEKTFEFIENILSEIMKLFPSPWIHIGGDECPRTRWAECPKCQALLKSENLTDESQLQQYFTKRITAFLRKKNRYVICWDEVTQAGMMPGLIVQSWRSDEGGVMAAKAGHDTIMSPTSHCYLDYPQSEKQKTAFPDWMSIIDTQKAYSFEPLPQQLTAVQAGHVLGGEGNIWTELVPQRLVDSRAFPRLTALAEVFWSPRDGRNWQDFARRLETQCKRFDLMGVRYFRPDQSQ